MSRSGVQFAFDFFQPRLKSAVEIYEPRLFIDSRLLFSMQTYLLHWDQL